MCQTKQNVRILWLITQIRNILKRKYHIIVSYRPIRKIINLDVLYFAFNNKNNKYNDPNNILCTWKYILISSNSLGT